MQNWCCVTCRHQVAISRAEKKEVARRNVLPPAVQKGRMRVATLIACWCALAPAAAQTFRGLDDAELARRAEKASPAPGLRRPRHGPRRGAGEP